MSGGVNIARSFYVTEGTETAADGGNRQGEGSV